MTFGEQLQMFREERGLTREGLSEASGVPFGTIHGYEIDRRAPSFGTVVQLSRALGVNWTAFGGCEDVGKPEPVPKPRRRRK